MVSTVIDLARKGYVQIKETRDDRGSSDPRYTYSIRLEEKDDAGLAPYESDVLALLKLVGAAEGITNDELEAWTTDHAPDMHERYRDFMGSVRTEGSSLGLVTSRFPLVVANIVVGGLVFLIALAGLDIQGQGGGFKAAPGPIIALVLVAAQLGMTPLLRRRTNKGASDYRKWMAFKHFLRDFSRVGEWRPSAVVIWEDYLVYAIPLGVAHDVGKAIDMNALPQLANGFSWYGFQVDAGRSLGDSIGGLTRSFVPSAAASFATKPSRAGTIGDGSSRGGGIGRGRRRTRR
jgi:hypothetical protein